MEVQGPMVIQGLRHVNHWIVVERVVDIADLDARTPRIRAVLDAQGWTNMVGDHHPAIKSWSGSSTPTFIEGEATLSRHGIGERRFM